MARRPRRRLPLEQVNKMAGVLATWTGTCPRCGGELHQSQVVRHHNDWIHVRCAPGQDDE
jgi:hypothetical protein